MVGENKERRHQCDLSFSLDVSRWLCINVAVLQISSFPPIMTPSAEQVRTRSPIQSPGLFQFLDFYG
jgi:hypothetical protein